MTVPIPICVGANVRFGDLPSIIGWIVEGQRDLELWEGQDPDILDNDRKLLVHQVRALLDGYSGRLGIHGPWDGLPLITRDGRVRALVVSRIKQAIEFSVELKASQIVLHSPFEFYGSPMVAHTPAFGLAEEIDLVHKTLDEVLPLARDANCELVLEVNYDTRSTPLIRLVESFDNELVRLSLDTGHAYIMQRLGGPPPDQWVRDAGPLLTHIHLEDTDGFYDRHWAPGEGNINWYAFFEALGELDHSPRLILEIKVAKIRSAAEWLERLGFAC